MLRVGMGYDVHQLVENRKLIMGGVEIPHEKGLLGHSDADVLIHAIMDALIGAIGEGDIGKHFPDTDAKYKGISSIKLLEYVGALLKARQATIHNIDATIIAQRPKMASYIAQMRENIARTLEIHVNQVNIKATTEEKLGFNIDATIIAQRPKMASYIAQMRENIARTLEIHVNQVNIKATTEEKLGFTGAEQGISSQAITLVDLP